MILAMLHLLASIILTRDYAETPITSDIDDLSQWVLESGSLVSQTSTNLVFDVSGAAITSYEFASPVTISQGSQFRFHVDVDTDATISIILIPFLEGVNLGPSRGASSGSLGAGTHSVDLDFNPGGYSFDQIKLIVQGVAEVDLSGTTISALGNAGDFVTGNRVLSYWDDSAEEVQVQLEVNPGATTSVITEGPNLGELERSQIDGVDIPRDPIPRRPLNQSYYKFCDGTTQVIFGFILSAPDFPYVQRYDFENSPECQATPIVCDIHFNESATVIVPSGLFQFNGSIQVQADSSFSSVRYTLDPTRVFSNYENSPPSDPAVTGLFEGLGPGTWTIYALDEKNCKKALTVIVPSFTVPGNNDPDDDYGTKYRLQYYDKQTGVQSIVDIEQRGYTGPIIEVKGNGMPFMINKSSGPINDKFSDVIRPTQGTFALISERHFQYIGLFSQDDTKYRIKHTHGSTSWVGFVVPSVYQEDYAPSIGYTVEITAADNLALLEGIEFTDDSGGKFLGDKSLLEVLFLCLKKTGLDLNIRSAVNRFAEGMDLGGDPLDQTFIDCAAFYDENDVPKKCAEVIEMCLKEFGAFVEQVDRKWLIIEVDSQTSPYDYREFSSDLSLVDDDTINPEKEIVTPSTSLSDVIFTGRGHSLAIIPAYGKLNVKLNLFVRPSIFPLSLDEWAPNLANAGPIYYQFFQVKDKRYKGIRFTNFFALSVGANKYTEIFSPVFTTTSSKDSVEISFNYKADYAGIDARALNRGANPIWVRLYWRLKLIVGGDTFYFSEHAGWNEDGYNDNAAFTSQFFGESANFSKVIDLPNITPSAEIELQASLRFEGADYSDFADLAALKAIDTTVLPVGTKIRGVIPHSDWDFVIGSVGQFYYTLDSSNEAESDHFTELPSVVRPDDYDGGTNQVVWKLETGNGGSFYRQIQNFELSEYRMRFLPNHIDPLTESAISVVNNKNFKENLEYEINAGDVPTDILQPEIYSNILKLEDGTPTKNWTRAGFNEIKALQGILLKNLTNQYYKPTWRLAGTWLAEDLKLNSILKHTVIATAVAVQNEEPPTLSPWTDTGSGQPWADSLTYAVVEFTASLTGDSLYRTQPVDDLLAGIRVRVAFHITRLDSSGDRIDRFVAVLMSGGQVVQKVVLADGISGDIDMDLAVNFNIDRDADSIGFFIENLAGDGGFADYRVYKFHINGVASVRYFYANAFERGDRDNKYTNELVQLIPAVASTDPDIDDTGGGETDGNVDGTGGGSAGRAFSNGFSSGFD